MGSKDSATPEKKTLGYKEQCPEKRKAYQEQLATAQAAGKTLIYLDETGFAEETFRSYGYAPRGPMCPRVDTESTDSHHHFDSGTIE